MRLSNAAAGLNDTNRVENEVATMIIFADAIKNISTHLVPKVYGWGSAAEGQGWIFQEFMTGRGLTFKSITTQGRRLVLQQIAEILGALQKHQLPDTVKEHGGLKFDGDGAIASGPMTLIAGGPFQSYAALYKGLVDSALNTSDESSILKGWKPKNVRKRLEQFLSEGLHQVLCEADSSTKMLVHGDLSGWQHIFYAVARVQPIQFLLCVARQCWT